MKFKNNCLIVLALILCRHIECTSYPSPGSPLFDYYLCSQKSVMYFFSDNPKGANQEWAVSFWVKFKTQGKTTAKSPFVIFRDGQNGNNGQTVGLYTVYDIDNDIFKLYFESTYLMDIIPSASVNDYASPNFDKSASPSPWYYIMVSAAIDPNNSTNKIMYVYVNDTQVYSQSRQMQMSFFYTILHIGAEVVNGDCYEIFLMHRLEVFKFAVDSLTLFNWLKGENYSSYSGSYLFTKKRQSEMQIYESQSRLPPIQIIRDYGDKYFEPIKEAEYGYYIYRNAKFMLPDQIAPSSPVNRSYTIAISYNIASTGYAAYKHTTGNPQGTYYTSDFYPYLRVSASESSKSISSMVKQLGVALVLNLQYQGIPSTGTLKPQIKSYVNNVGTVTHSLASTTVTSNAAAVSRSSINITVKDEIFSAFPSLSIFPAGLSKVTTNLNFQLSDADKHLFGSDTITSDPSFVFNIYNVQISKSTDIDVTQLVVSYQSFCNTNCLYCDNTGACLMCTDRYVLANSVCTERAVPDIWDPFTGKCFTGTVDSSSSVSTTNTSMTVNTSSICSVPNNSVLIFALQYSAPNNNVSKTQYKKYYAFGNSLFYSSLNFYTQEFTSAQLSAAISDACTTLNSIFSYYSNKPGITTPKLYYKTIDISAYYANYTVDSDKTVDSAFACYKFGLYFYSTSFYNGVCVSQCPAGTKQSADGHSCEPCTAGCAICGTDGTCTACEDGKYLDPIGLCRSCIKPCVKCSGSANFCEETFKPLVMYNDIMGVTYTYPFCRDAVAQCAKCDDVDQSVCAGCNPGFYLHKGLCLSSECDCVNCSFCDTNGDCMFCDVNFELKGKSQCVAADVMAAQIDGNNALMLAYNLQMSTAVKQSETQYADDYIDSLHPENKIADNGIVSCLPGYYMYNDSCYECIEGCGTCVDSFTCSQCVYPYDYDPVQHACSISSSVSSNVYDECNNCTVCFKNGEYKCSICSNCATSCSCSTIENSLDNSFSVACPGVTFDSAYLNSYSTPGITMAISSEALAINFKFKPNGSKTFLLSFNQQMISKTENCKFDFGQTIVLTNKLYVDMSSASYVTASAMYGPVIDTASAVASLLSFSFASQLIALIQFNQIFLFFSFLDVPIGGLYNYINSLSISQAKSDADIRYVQDKRKFKYEDIREVKKIYKLKKISSLSPNTIGCLALMAIASVVNFIIRYAVKSKAIYCITNEKVGNDLVSATNNDKRIKALKFVHKAANKVAFILLQSVMLQKVPVILFWADRLRMSNKKSVGDVFVFATGFIEYSLMCLYVYLLIKYIKRGKVKDGIFKTFESEKSAKEEVVMNSLKLIELIFMLASAAVLFVFFKFALFAIFSILALKLLEMAASFACTRSSMLLISVPKAVTNVFFVIFVAFAAALKLKCKINGTLVQIIYVTANVCKIAELVFGYLYVRQQNKKYKVVPAKEIVTTNAK